MPVNATATAQTWTIGSVVRVGFMRLQIVAIVPTPGDYAPDVYVMTDPRNNRQYEFTPHIGLARLDVARFDQR